MPAAKSAAKPKAETKEVEPTEVEETTEDEQPGDLTNEQIREQADAIKTECQYNGVLTGEMLRALEPLLYLRTPEKFIERRMQGENGAPYDMTGVRSIQVQIDRFNAVLGQTHWRTFTRFMGDGTICHGRIVVGNRLGGLVMDAEGNLFQSEGVEILVEREGWGGWKRGKNPGDTYKSSETNALKRVFARFGPAAEIYSLDFEDDPANEQPAAPAGMVQRAAAAAPYQPPQMSDEEALLQLSGMLVENNPADPRVTDELLAKRKEAIDAMNALPQKPSPQVIFGIMAARAYDIRQLDAATQRARASMPAVASEQADQTPEHAPEDENQAAVAPIPEEVG